MQRPSGQVVKIRFKSKFRTEKKAAKVSTGKQCILTKTKKRLGKHMEALNEDFVSKTHYEELEKKH